MLGSCLGADTSAVSPHLLPWQHRHIPTLPHPWTSCHPQLQSLLLTLADLHCSPHSASTLPPIMSSPTDPFPTQPHSGLYQPFMQSFISVSPPLTPNPLLSYHFSSHSTHPFPPPQQWCTQVMSESRGKGLVEGWDRLPACSSCAQASLMLSHGGSITEMLFSFPVTGASWTALRDLVPCQPSAQTKGRNMLSKYRIRNISWKLYINITDSNECVLSAIFQTLTICPNLHEKGKKYVHWQNTFSHRVLNPWVKSNIKKKKKQTPPLKINNFKTTKKSHARKTPKIKQANQHFSVAFVSKTTELILTKIFQ